MNFRISNCFLLLELFFAVLDRMKEFKVSNKKYVNVVVYVFNKTNIFHIYILQSN